jgi:hypothetical protein
MPLPAWLVLLVVAAQAAPRFPPAAVEKAA